MPPFACIATAPRLDARRARVSPPKSGARSSRAPRARPLEPACHPERFARARVEADIELGVALLSLNVESTVPLRVEPAAPNALGRPRRGADPRPPDDSIGKRRDRPRCDDRSHQDDDGTRIEPPQSQEPTKTGNRNREDFEAKCRTRPPRVAQDWRVAHDRRGGTGKRRRACRSTRRGTPPIG